MPRPKRRLPALVLKVTDVVAIGLGTAIFYILMRFVMLPSPVPNTNIALCYPFLALLALAFGPLVAALAGFLGHLLNDLTLYGSAWISWIIVSGVLGALLGLLKRPMNIRAGTFGWRKTAAFSLYAVAANLLCWGVLAPLLDMLIYAEPAARVYTQGALSALVNALTTAVIGSLLLKSYAAGFIQRQSLAKAVRPTQTDEQTHTDETTPTAGYTQPAPSARPTLFTTDSAPCSDALITLQDFSLTYDAQQAPTLKGLSCAIYPGQKVAIIGGSGSGKSTLLKCLNGTIPQLEHGNATGSLVLAGHPFGTAAVHELSHQVGSVLQDSDAQFVGLTVAEDIAFALENDACALTNMRAEVAHWADRLALGELLARGPHQLSGGQKQRVALAGVLISKPRILLLDEPLAALDPAAAEACIQLIDELHRAYGLTTLIIEHRLEALLSGALDRVLLLDEGELRADVTPAQLLQAGLLPAYGLREPRWLEALRSLGCAPDALSSPALDGISEQLLAPLRQHCNGAGGAQETGKQEDLSVVAPGHASCAAQPQPQQGSVAPQLVIRGLCYRYPGSHVDGIQQLSLEIHAGESVALVGTNGAGKSTLAALLAGFMQPQAGTLHWYGEPLAERSLREVGDCIGYVLQDFNQMLSASTVYEEVALALKLRGLDKATMDVRVKAILAVCGLDDVGHWPLSALSHGQKKRLSIAAVLVTEPPLLILDEPTAGQDYRHSREMMAFIQRLNQRGHSILLITHDMDLMLEYTQRALVFAQGRLIADATPCELLSRHAVMQQAALRPSSLFQLAQRVDQRNPGDLVRRWLGLHGHQPRSSHVDTAHEGVRHENSRHGDSARGDSSHAAVKCDDACQQGAGHGR